MSARQPRKILEQAHRCKRIAALLPGAEERIPPGSTRAALTCTAEPLNSSRIVPGEAYQRHRSPPRQFNGGRDLPICQCPVHTQGGAASSDGVERA
jgi:hypothetical protein